MPRSLDLFRKAMLGCGLALALFGTAYAGKVNVLYPFKGGNDGAEPISGVISDSQGNLYGTTWEGGGSGCGGQGCGTVFELAPDGTETVLYAFQGFNGGPDPVAPLGLVRDKDGNLYGVTENGGTGNCQGGCGTVFRLAPDGTMTLLHAFDSGSDGAFPGAGLLRDNRGNLYGTTLEGGAHGRGTVFRIAPDGAESVIYAFCAQTNCADGASPWSALIADKAGNLYGTTTEGGNPAGGTVFRIAPNGVETVLYNFCSVQPDCQDGYEPYAGVTMDQAGNLYGTTSWGGALDDAGLGTVFKLAPDGTETVLHSFWLETDGANPMTGVIVDKVGDIYGTLTRTYACKTDLGSVYRLSPDGSEKLHCIATAIYAGVMERNGYLYGTGAGSDKYPSGVVFALEPFWFEITHSLHG
jgi:uncharacterized repeat protein (TIGR03803 family)